MFFTSSSDKRIGLGSGSSSMLQLSNDLHHLVPSVHIGPGPGQPTQLNLGGGGVVGELLNRTHF